VGTGASYLRAVLPGVVVVGLGLSLTIAPLTAAALGAVEEKHAGIASAVNNAVARVAGLLAVATLPLAAGIGAGSLTDPAALAPTYRNAMFLCAGLLVAAAALALVAIPSRAVEAAPAPPEAGATAPRLRATLVRTHCAVAGPPLHPAARSSG